MNKIALEIELTGYDLDLASYGIASALALLEAQGYTDGSLIHAGVSLAGAFIEACQQAIGKKGGVQ